MIKNGDRDSERTPEEIREEAKRLWNRLKKVETWDTIDHSKISTYTEYDTSDYHRGMFADTKCNSAKVHSYGEMESLLKQMQGKYPSDVKPVSTGKSQGYGGPENALDVWLLHMLATKEPKRTAFFIAGHHPEYSGPETIYALAERLLKSYHTGNPNVKVIRKNTHMVFIPQVDADLYDNLGKAGPMDRGDYFLEGYSWLIDINDPEQVSNLRRHEMNYYCVGDRTEEHYFAQKGYYPFAQTTAVQNAVFSCIEEFGKPVLAVDYHECDEFHKYWIAQLNARLPAYYILAELAKSVPVRNSLEAEYGMESQRVMDILKTDPMDIMADMGAACFYTEAPVSMAGDQPGKQKQTILYPLEKRIEMNLIATDRILARYFLGI